MPQGLGKGCKVSQATWDIPEEILDIVGELLQFEQIEHDEEVEKEEPNEEETEEEEEEEEIPEPLGERKRSLESPDVHEKRPKIEDQIQPEAVPVMPVANEGKSEQEFHVDFLAILLERKISSFASWPLISPGILSEYRLQGKSQIKELEDLCLKEYF